MNDNSSDRLKWSTDHPVSYVAAPVTVEQDILLTAIRRQLSKYKELLVKSREWDEPILQDYAETYYNACLNLLDQHEFKITPKYVQNTQHHPEHTNTDESVEPGVPEL